MTTTDRTAELAEAQNRLTRALLAEPRNVTEIIELAERVHRAERAAVAAERGRRLLTVPGSSRATERAR